jgi:hypothetical protein
VTFFGPFWEHYGKDGFMQHDAMAHC